MGKKGNISLEGYRKNSPDRFNDFNIIPSQHIDMNNVDHDVLMIPMGGRGTGNPVLAKPGERYFFPNHELVFEQAMPENAMMRYQRIAKFGGLHKAEDGYEMASKRLMNSFMPQNSNVFAQSAPLQFPVRQNLPYYPSNDEDSWQDILANWQQQERTQLDPGFDVYPNRPYNVDPGFDVYPKRTGPGPIRMPNHPGGFYVPKGTPYPLGPNRGSANLSDLGISPPKTGETHSQWSTRNGIPGGGFNGAVLANQVWTGQQWEDSDYTINKFGGPLPKAQDGWESKINNYLGNPLGRAQQMSTTNGRENDALRHAYASMYASENAGPFVANALGLGHEIMGQPNTWKEHTGDVYNNFVGSMVGALPFISTSDKEKAIKKLHELGLLSSGTKAYGGLVPMAQDGREINSLEADLITKVLMNRNRDKDFIQRAYALGQNPGMFSLPDPDQFGSRMSHKMGWGEDDQGQAYMFPTVMNPGNENIKVPNQYADYISSIGYKKEAGIPYQAYGGDLPKAQMYNSQVNRPMPNFDPRVMGPAMRQQQIAAHNRAVAQSSTPDVLQERVPQKFESKALDVVTNPFTAATNMYQHGYLPDNFTQGQSNYLDLAQDYINPASLGRSMYNAATNVFDPEMYKDFAKAGAAGMLDLINEQIPQEYKDASMRSLQRLGDMASAVPGIKSASPYVKKALETTQKQLSKGAKVAANAADKKIVKPLQELTQRTTPIQNYTQLNNVKTSNNFNDLDAVSNYFYNKFGSTDNLLKNLKDKDFDTRIIDAVFNHGNDAEKIKLANHLYDVLQGSKIDRALNKADEFVGKKLVKGVKAPDLKEVVEKANEKLAKGVGIKKGELPVKLSANNPNNRVSVKVGDDVTGFIDLSPVGRPAPKFSDILKGIQELKGVKPGFAKDYVDATNFRNAQFPGLAKSGDFPFTVAAEDIGKQLMGQGYSGEINKAISEALKERGSRLYSGATGHTDLGRQRYENLLSKGYVEDISPKIPGSYNLVQPGNEIFMYKKKGGALLNKTLTCPKCGWSWKAVDGGTDITTCHKCGGTAKMKFGGGLDEPDKEYRRGGALPNRRETNKNIKSSINNLMRRNETLFGPAGRNFYNPNPMKKYYKGGIAFPQAPTAGDTKGQQESEFYSPNWIPPGPVGFYEHGGIAYPQQPTSDYFFSGSPWMAHYDMGGGLPSGANNMYMPCMNCGGYMENGGTPFQQWMLNNPKGVTADTTLVPHKKWTQSVQASKKAYTDPSLLKAFRQTYGDSFDDEVIPSRVWDRDVDVNPVGANAYLRYMSKPYTVGSELDGSYKENGGTPYYGEPTDNLTNTRVNTIANTITYPQRNTAGVYQPDKPWIVKPMTAGPGSLTGIPAKPTFEPKYGTGVSEQDQLAAFMKQNPVKKYGGFQEGGFMSPDNMLNYPTFSQGGDPYGYADGGINNPGFRALPQNVQQNIISNMADGGNVADYDQEQYTRILGNNFMSGVQGNMSPNLMREAVTQYVQNPYQMPEGEYGYNMNTPNMMNAGNMFDAQERYNQLANQNKGALKNMYGAGMFALGTANPYTKYKAKKAGKGTLPGTPDMATNQSVGNTTDQSAQTGMAKYGAAYIPAAQKGITMKGFEIPAGSSLLSKTAPINFPSTRTQQAAANPDEWMSADAQAKKKAFYDDSRAYDQKDAMYNQMQQAGYPNMRRAYPNMKDFAMGQQGQFAPNFQGMYDNFGNDDYNVGRMSRGMQNMLPYLMSNPQNTYLQEFNAKKALFGPGARKVSMKFRTVFDPRTGQQVQVPAEGKEVAKDSKSKMTNQEDMSTQKDYEDMNMFERMKSNRQTRRMARDDERREKKFGVQRAIPENPDDTAPAGTTFANNMAYAPAPAQSGYPTPSGYNLFNASLNTFPMNSMMGPRSTPMNIPKAFTPRTAYSLDPQGNPVRNTMESFMKSQLQPQRYGGMYEVGGIQELTEDEIQQIMEAGGSVTYLD